MFHTIACTLGSENAIVCLAVDFAKILCKYNAAMKDKQSSRRKIGGLMTLNTPKYPKLLALEKILELPMLFLSFVWLCILITELVYSTNPVISYCGTGIWILFIFYFAVRLATVDDQKAFFKRNWLFVLAILASVLRFFPFMNSFPLVRALTATFGMQVIWIFASAEQGMSSIRRSFGRRGAAYVLTFTLVVIFAGAAGMLHFERISDDPQSIHTYPNALWWTAMQITNIGSGYPIKTTGGRILCLAISVYAIAVFGYLTALIATFFIDRVTKDQNTEIARQKSLQDIQEEIIRLRHVIEDFVNRPSSKN